MSIIVSTNIGSFIANKSKLHDELTDIENTYGKIDALLLQEFNDFKKRQITDTNNRIPPFFLEPAHTNEPTHINHTHCRGVATFLRNHTDNALNTPNVKSEIITTLHTTPRPGRGGRKTRNTKTAIINVYNNHNLCIKQLRHDIDNNIIQCERAGFLNIVIVGDFNTEKFAISGFHEIKHKNLYHKHNKEAKKTHIDKIYANFKQVKVLDVRNSLEKIAETDNSLGHKVIVLGLYEQSPLVERSSTNYGKLARLTRKKHATDNLKHTYDNDYWKTVQENYTKNDMQNTKELIDNAAKALIDFTTETIKNATVTTKKRPKVHYAIEKAQDLVENNITDQNSLKTLYRFVGNVKNGIEHVNTQLPPLQNFKDKLENKLHGLNDADIDEASKIITECYENFPSAKHYGLTFPPNSFLRYQCIGYYIDHIDISLTPEGFSSNCTQNYFHLNFPNRSDFRRIILSVNKSGATDYCGISTKASSTMLRQSDTLLEHTYQLMKAICLTGHIPDSFKKDIIVFLYKRKGEITDAANYRPITHAPAFGKHLEKILLHALKKITDGNTENHAYTAKHSIFSAITDLITTLQNFKRLNQTFLEGADKRKYQILPVVLAEDISGAFESLVHTLMTISISAMHQLSHSTAEQSQQVGIKIDKLIASYLKRTSQVTDKSKCIKLQNKEGRSTPQGSSVSPQLWRIHDHLFSTKYRELIEKLPKSIAVHVVAHKHIAYADDHVTVLALKIPYANPQNDSHVEPFLQNT